MIDNNHVLRVHVTKSSCGKNIQRVPSFTRVGRFSLECVIVLQSFNGIPPHYMDCQYIFHPCSYFSLDFCRRLKCVRFSGFQFLLHLCEAESMLSLSHLASSTVFWSYSFKHLWDVPRRSFLPRNKRCIFISAVIRSLPNLS